MNDSSTGGFLTPTSAPLTEDDALDAVLQQLVVGITALDPTLVRPRWQQVPVNRPDVNTNWCAIGIVDEEVECSAAIVHHPDGNGYDELQRHVAMNIMASFYGPQGRGYANIFRDGLSIPQNTELLYSNQMRLRSTQVRIVALPEYVNTLWYKRFDASFVVVRMVDRTYGILNLVEAQGTITNDATRTDNWQAGPNPPNLYNED